MFSQQISQDFISILPAVLYEYVRYNEENSEFLYMSPMSINILGHSPEYFIEDINRLWAIIHPDDLKRIQREDIKANTENTFFLSELRLLLPTGEVRWLQISSKPTTEKKDNAVIWVGYMIDITRLKYTEAELVKANRALKSLSMTDGLTGISNRRHFDEAFHEEWARYKRTEKPFSLIMLDVDLFKNYNDTYGHLLGDDCLKSIAKVLQDSTRRVGDLAARYGGEEFIIIAFNTDIAGAYKMAEKIRLSVEALNIKNENTPLGKVTVSCGVASIEHNEYPDEEGMLSAADSALYQAKSDNRNCVRVADANKPFFFNQ